MIALDTNVVVRYLTDDPPALAARAQKQIETGQCWVAQAVLLETVQVLESVYEVDRPGIAAALRTLLGLEGVTVERALAAGRAAEWIEAGLDPADAIVLASASGHSALATFDRDFLRRGTILAVAPPLVEPR